MKFKNVPLALLLALAVGCNSGNTDAGDEDFSSNTYSGNPGEIMLELIDDSIAVGDSAGFRVTVTDSTGMAVPFIRISCDTEQGLSLIEPTTGIESTDAMGQMSGVVGCERPGSYLIGCRLPLGGNKRQFATIICGGDVPPGFTGFPGASGGGLGGGAVAPEDGGRGESDELAVRVTQLVSVDGATNEPNDTVDLFRTANCSAADPDAEPVAEPFSVEYMRISVRNEGFTGVRFDRYSVNIGNSGGTASTGILSLTSEVDSRVGEEATFDVLYLDIVPVTGVTGVDAAKVLPDRSTVVEAGFRNVTVTLYGTDELGESVQISSSRTVSFNNYNNCP